MEPLGRLVVAAALLLGGASCGRPIGGEGGERGASASGGEGGAETTATATGGSDDECDPSDDRTSEAFCACQACEADGGICETNCYDAMGPQSIHCFQPLPPGPDESARSTGPPSTTSGPSTSAA